MISVAPTTALVAGVLLAMLIVGSGWALAAGLAARREARTAVDASLGLRARLDAAPARAMLVRSDGRVEAAGALTGWLGLMRPAEALSDLSDGDSGLAAEDATALTEDILAAQRAARPFRRSVRAQHGSRILLAVGDRAPAALNAPGGVLVWFFDATEVQGEVIRLDGELRELHSAFDALAGLIEVAPLPMWYRDRDLNLAMVNSAYVNAVEAEGAADVVRRQVELIEGQGMGGPLAQPASARETGKPLVSHLPATIGGERRMLRVHDVPLPSGGTAGFAVDIDELEQARAGIKRFAMAQRSMLDLLSAGVAQFSAERTLTFCNQPFRRMFAMRTEWLADRPEFDRVLERMREAKRVPEVRDFPGWKAERREWFTAAESATEEAWNLPGGIHLRVVAQPLPEGGLLLIFEDRTEQVQLASARDTLLRTRTATFDNLSEAIGVFAADGRLQLWNNKFRAIWGFEEEFLAGHPRVDSLAKKAAPRLADPKRASVIGEMVRFATAERMQRGGRVQFADGRHFDIAAVPLPDGNALFTMLDVTDSRRMERALRDRNEALEVADRVKTGFVASMSYELRTPLTSIQGFAEMLHGGYAGPLTEGGRDYVEAILNSVARLSVLVDDVLDLTQNEDFEPARKPVDLELLAHAASESHADRIRAKQLDFAVEITGSAGSVAGEQRRLRQAIEHVLSHAIGHTPSGGRVLLHIDGDERSARIVVSDNGPGMSKAEIERAFDRFARHDISRDDERPLGLGMPLAKRFVVAHGGTIEMLSEKGEGTMVTIILPRG